jgi:hypothetical protein
MSAGAGTADIVGIDALVGNGNRRFGVCGH